MENSLDTLKRISSQGKDETLKEKGDPRQHRTPWLE